MIQPEFPVWERARHWSYGLQLGLEEGFQANEIEFLTIPALYGYSCSDQTSWLSRARALCTGKHFDQVWVEIVKSNLDERFLEWLTKLAPIRIGLMPESFECLPEDGEGHLSLIERESEVKRRLNYFTHALAIDEKDAEEINAKGRVLAMWCPMAVPERFLCGQDLPAPKPYALFHGALSGHWMDWIRHSNLQKYLVNPTPPENTTEYPMVFDRLHQLGIAFLGTGSLVTESALETYLNALRRIRRDVFALWMKSLQEGCAVVNLAHFAKSYVGQVIESMAAGRPVISWEIPDRPRNKALFEDGEEVLLFPQEDPSALAAHIQRILQDESLGRRLGKNALEKVRRWHTTEKRVEQILHWVETGEEPVYGDVRGTRDFRGAFREPNRLPSQKTDRNMKIIYEKYREYVKDKPQVVKVQETFLENYKVMVRQEYGRVQRLIEGGQTEEAISGLKELLRLSPDHSLAHDDLGALYYQKGDQTNALEHFVQALDADPNNMNAMKNLADLSLELGRHDEAVEFYRKILAERPADVDALLGVGNYCLQTGHPEDAKLFFRKVLEINPEHIVAKSNLETLEGGSPASPSSPSGRAPAEALSREPIKLPQGKLVSIVILVHDQLEYTQKCLESIFTHTNIPFEIIIVDNGSTDGTVECLGAIKKGTIEIGGWRFQVDQEGKVARWMEGASWRGRIPEPGCKYIKVIRNEKNLGFAAGNNQGMAIALGDYLLLLNNDVVVTPGWLDRLMSRAEQKTEIGIVGPMSNAVSGPQQVSAIGYNPQSLTGLDQFAQAFARDHAGKGQRFWRLVGFCMLIKRAVIEKIGGFDLRYGLGHYEDDDLSLRAAFSGFESWIAQDCFVHHFGSKTFSGARIDLTSNLEKNWMIFKEKWGLPKDLPNGAQVDLSTFSRRSSISAKLYSPLILDHYSVAY